MNRVLLCVLLVAALVYPSFAECEEQRQNYIVSSEDSLRKLITDKNATSCANVLINSTLGLTRPLEFPTNLTSDLLISGKEDFVTITCLSHSGLFFQGARNVQIQKVHFVNCSLDSENASIAFFNGRQIEIINCIFTNYTGSAVLLQDVNETAVEGCSFTGNSSSCNSPPCGAITIRQYEDIGNNATIYHNIENCRFTNNSHIPSNFSDCSPITKYAETANHTGYGGGIDIKLFTENTIVNITILNSKFSLNSAMFGGAVSVWYANMSRSVLKVYNSSFESNRACTHGGAISVRADSTKEESEKNKIGKIIIDTCTFENNTAFWGGAVSVYRCRTCGTISLTARNSTWINNSANSSGFGMALGGNETETDARNPHEVKEYYLHANLFDCKFSNHNIYYHLRTITPMGSLAVEACNLTFSGHTQFRSNQGTALVLKSLSRAMLQGNITFDDNFGVNGGAILLSEASQLHFNSSCNIGFSNNKAISKGGAIYSKSVHESYGFFSVPCPLVFHDDHNATFEHNVASYSNQSIYIGNPLQCNVTEILSHTLFKPNTNPNQNIETIANSTSFETSPTMINDELNVMLGEKFFLQPQIIDMFKHNFSSSFGYLALLSEKYLESVDYALVGPTFLGMDRSTNSTGFFIKGKNITNSAVKLIIEYHWDHTAMYRLSSTGFKVRVTPCKLGYTYSEENKVCSCVQNQNIICPDDDKVEACIKQGYWYDDITQNTFPCPSRYCNFSNGNCPLNSKKCETTPGYCALANSSDDLCWTGRGGRLCSQCQTNHSFNFGGYMCVN